MLLFDLTDSKGEIRKAEVKIPVLGAYSQSFPLKCGKSDRILKESAAYYASQLSGAAQLPVEIGDLEKSLVGLFLPSTGDVTYLPVVRQIFDAELNLQTAADKKKWKIRVEAKEVVQQGKLAPKEQADYESKRLAEIHTPEEVIAFKGISNSPCHYLGSAKILSRIGEAFAEALIHKKGSK